MSRIFLKQEDMHRGSLILINRRYCCRETGQDSLVPAYEGASAVFLHPRAATLLENLMQEIHGWESIVPVSGFRSFREQNQIWEDSLAESGREFTEKFVAAPGHSEHQTGLAIDLGLRLEEIDFICPEFPYSGICQIFREKAAEYGFVERYPAGKELITGIGHEPWHFRYVGTPHALIMKRQGLVLEEYVEFLKSRRYGSNPYRYEREGRLVEISYVPAQTDKVCQESGTVLEIDEARPYSISGNNIDGYIITQWNGLGKGRKRAV